VLEALGAPPAQPGFAWHDQAAVAGLFASHGLSASLLSTHEIAFTASSPQAYLEAQRDEHPMAVTGFRVLQQLGKDDEAGVRLLAVLTEHNEDPTAFRATSRYVLFALSR
jgi:hypothetical protein